MNETIIMAITLTVAIAVFGFCFLLALKYAIYAVNYLVRRLFPLPVTRFGFPGILIYSDSSPQSKVFVNHRYELSAKPDFIFKIGWNQYVIVEYKSRNAGVHESDIAQLRAACLAVRSEMNVVAGYVVTPKTQKLFTFGSNRSVYRQIRAAHKIAKSIKYCGKAPRIARSDKCKTCGYSFDCH